MKQLTFVFVASLTFGSAWAYQVPALYQGADLKLGESLIAKHKCDALNMDMMVKMGRKLPSPLKEEAMKVRDTIYQMMDRAAKGAF